ncbi:glycosyltransferase [Paenibacillus sp. MER TA 81-3]|uniref:glycosyltransferase family 2 protein n=1 Tax=Paenibacillus sp. MER TA 81-3 TaxID=2939573 RepID=UPI00203DA5AF|nr:glycosyltransferase family 2 protein [Paenibacillus sp. MER TA 81-3]MCM3338743.1 glycosyltransferase [Paenibacillus sp. MER TA 81-3]
MNFSAIIPVHNGKALLEQTILTLLRQTVAPTEIIVVDDGSTDGTSELLHQLAQIYSNIIPTFLNENRGVSYARNLGVSHSTGNWCLFIDADDLVDSLLLEKYIKHIHELEEQGSSIDMLFCAYEQIDEKNNKITSPSRFRQIDSYEYLGYLFYRNPIVSTSGVAIKREVFQHLNGFNQEFTYSEDWDLWLRVAEKNVVSYIDEVLVQIRRHPNNTSRVINNMQYGERLVLKQYTPDFIKKAIFQRGLSEDQNRLDYVSIAYRLDLWDEGYNELNKVSKDSDSLYFYKGLYHLNRQDYKRANDCFIITYQMNHNHLAALNNSACCLWMIGDEEQSVIILRKLVNEMPDYMDAVFNCKQLSREPANKTIDLRYTWRELRKVLTVYQS